MLSPLIIKLVIPIVVLIIGVVIGKLVKRALSRIMKSTGLNSALKSFNMNFNLENFIVLSVTYLIYFFSVLVALEILGIGTYFLRVVTWAVILFVLISLFLSLKDVIPSAVAGLIILVNRLFKEGDLIAVNEMEGKIKKMNLLEVSLETASGDILIVPNSFFMKNIVVKKKKR